MAEGLDMLKSVAPELGDEEDERLERFIEMAAQRISAKVFGKVYPQAVAYLAAHMVTLSNRKRDTDVAAAGPVTSVSTGGLSMQFDGGGPEGDELDSTPYGRQFQQLRDSRARTKGMLL